MPGGSGALLQERDVSISFSHKAIGIASETWLFPGGGGFSPRWAPGSARINGSALRGCLSKTKDAATWRGLRYGRGHLLAEVSSVSSGTAGPDGSAKDEAAVGRPKYARHLE